MKESKTSVLYRSDDDLWKRRELSVCNVLSVFNDRILAYNKSATSQGIINV